LTTAVQQYLQWQQEQKRLQQLPVYTAQAVYGRPRMVLAQQHSSFTAEVVCMASRKHTMLLFSSITACFCFMSAINQAAAFTTGKLRQHLNSSNTQLHEQQLV
jgi:hypothetical protein